MPTDLVFEQIVRDHQQMVFRTLARLTGGGARDQRIEDLAQDVFLRLFRALPGFRGESMIGTYVYRITVNVAHTEWKRRQREERNLVSISAPLPGGGDQPDWESRLAHPGASACERMEQDEFAQMVEQQLNRLSAVERSVLVLYHQEERSYEQIAAILALPLGTVRTHLHRGRNKLRTALAQQKEEVHA